MLVLDGRDLLGRLSSLGLAGEALEVAAGEEAVVDEHVAQGPRLFARCSLPEQRGEEVDLLADDQAALDCLKVSARPC